jgi:diguanylate cyclase (GGDEF)-like protein
MKANSSLAILLSVGSFYLTRPKRNRTENIVGRICAVLVVLLAGTALFGHLTGRNFNVETWLATDAGPTPGRMSAQTATFLLVLGSLLTFEGTLQKSSTRIIDVLTMALVVIFLVIIAGYCFGAANLFGQSPYTRTSPQTLTCLALLAFTASARRTQEGFFSVLIGVGIGSQTSRIALPLALVLPFAIVSGGAYFSVAGWLSPPYGAALTASVTALLCLIFVVLMAQRINILERELRNLALTDELTTLHNRRSFYLLGEHTLREQRRYGRPVAILYFDVDGLKAVNDRLGHEVGSQLVVDFANLLRANFRNSDVVARVGGDEFAVVTRSTQTELVAALQRLDRATATVNLANGGRYKVSYSVGEATVGVAGSDSFAELVAQADAAMYARKRLKKLGSTRKESQRSKEELISS